MGAAGGRPRVHTAEPARTRRTPEELSDRGQRTRRTLIDSAREVFYQHGYLESKLSDITEHAGVAAGTFYIYFDNREELLAQIIAESYADSLDPRGARDVHEGRPLARIRHGNQVYVESYRTHADVHRIIEEASLVDESIRAMRAARALALFARNAQTIRELVRLGLVSPVIEPDSTARSLSLMVSRTCNYVYVQGHEFEAYQGSIGARHLAEELSDIWLRALGLDLA